MEAQTLTKTWTRDSAGLCPDKPQAKLKADAVQIEGWGVPSRQEALSKAVILSEFWRQRPQMMGRVSLELPAVSVVLSRGRTYHRPPVQLCYAFVQASLFLYGTSHACRCK